MRREAGTTNLTTISFDFRDRLRYLPRVQPLTPRGPELVKKRASRRPSKNKISKHTLHKPNRVAKGKAAKTGEGGGAQPSREKAPPGAGRKKTKTTSQTELPFAHEPAPPAREESPAPRPRKPKARERINAETLGGLQREISISEFFTKNRHLLGFDNASRALLTSVKEAVDNSLDACEEAGILPEVIVRLEHVRDNRFRMTVEDNGPGIVKMQIPKVFGKLLYGSKFHRLRQSRGQQGIGISAAGMYGQLTTGRPVVITSKTGKNRQAYYYELIIDTSANRPRIIKEELVDWVEKDHGTRVSIQMEASYKGGKRSVDEYIQAVASSNPHVRLEYWRPGKPPIVYPRVTNELPPETKEIKPHPYGVELGILMRMLHSTASRTLQGFLSAEFSRVSSKLAAEIVAKTELPPLARPKDLNRRDIDALYNAIGTTKIMAPPTNCLAPIGETAMLDGLKALLVQQHMAAEEAKDRRKQADDAPAPEIDEAEAIAAAESLVTGLLDTVTNIEPLDDEDPEAEQEAEAEAGAETGESDADTGPLQKAGVIDLFGKSTFVTAVTRSPKVYRGNPFQVEASLAYGGELGAENLAQVYRFANRVPLLYQQGACAMTQAVMRTNWKSYNITQSRGALPTGPLLIMVHIASVWVPFTSEAKEAVAHYDEIITELKFALQECGRRLARHINRRRRVADAEKKQRYIERYIPHIGEALQEILALSTAERDKTIHELTGLLERQRKM